MLLLEPTRFLLLVPAPLEPLLLAPLLLALMLVQPLSALPAF